MNRIVDSVLLASSKLRKNPKWIGLLVVLVLAAASLVTVRDPGYAAPEGGIIVAGDDTAAPGTVSDGAEAQATIGNLRSTGGSGDQDGDIAVKSTGGNLAVRDIDAGTATVTVTAGGGAITDGNGTEVNVIAHRFTATAFGGIGATDAIETSVKELVVTDTGGKFINIDPGGTDLESITATTNNGSVTTTTGSVYVKGNMAFNRPHQGHPPYYLYDTPGFDGSLKLTNAGGDIAVGAVDVGNENDVTLHALDGAIVLHYIRAQNVYLTAPGGIREADTDDDADVVANYLGILVDPVAGSGTGDPDASIAFGSVGDPIETNIDVFNAHTNGRHILMEDREGGLVLDKVDAGADMVWIVAQGGPITGTEGSGTSHLTAQEAVLKTDGENGGAIGTDEKPLRTSVDAISAETWDGGIYISDDGGPAQTGKPTDPPDKLVIPWIHAKEGGIEPLSYVYSGDDQA